MLTAIRKKQLSLGHGLIILLLGSWMTYACQPCFACTDSTGLHQKTTMKMPCHQAQHQQDSHHHSPGGHHPGHQCNCHFYAAVAISDPGALLSADATRGFNFLPVLTNTAESQPWPAMVIGTGIYPEPERATSPPFHRYTVLLN